MSSNYTQITTTFSTALIGRERVIIINRDTREGS